jgi:plastocyanin
MNRILKAAARPALALAIVLSGAASTAAPPPGAPMHRAPAAPRTSAAAPATAAVVHIENFTFSSKMLTVKAGTTVTWTNADDIPHTVVANDGAFRSKVLDTGDSFSFKFTKPGQFGYYCGIHPHMVGTIFVTA